MRVRQRLETREELKIRPQRAAQMRFKRGCGELWMSAQQGVVIRRCSENIFRSSEAR